MKISKLFHWLYATLMLLPIFAVGGKMLYVVFNPNAENSYSQNYITKAVKINNNTLAYLIEHNELTLISLNSVNSANTGALYWYSSDYDFETNFNLGFTPSGMIYSNNNNAGTNQYFMFYNSADNTWTSWRNKPSNFKFQMNFEFKNYDVNGFQFYNAFSVIYNYEKVNTLDNVFYDSITEISTKPIFSWADSSFLAQPLLYITDLFGIPNNSPIITLLSYWLTISIIWLVFDLIMYVPLLVHRWIDKGVLE